MLSRPCLLLLGTLLASIPTAHSFGRRDVGNIPIGATAYVVCHGSLVAREGQEFISLEPIPILVDGKIDPASLETFNGTSDTPEATTSEEFKHYLEASLGSPASGQCHLSASLAAARGMLDFWYGQYGPPANPQPRLISWAGPVPEARKPKHPGRRQAARMKPEPIQLEAR